MADTTLNARIQTRYDTLANWSRTDVAGQYSQLVLLEGEVAICYIPASSSTLADGTVVTTAPTSLIKVGDGVSTFASLPWASALAADVYDWAKAAEKPTYTIDEVNPDVTLTVNLTTAQYISLVHGGSLSDISYTTNGTLTTSARSILFAVNIDSELFDTFRLTASTRAADYYYLVGVLVNASDSIGLSFQIVIDRDTSTLSILNYEAAADNLKGISWSIDLDTGAGAVAFGSGVYGSYNYDFSSASAVKLPSATGAVNIKTINGETLVGTGDITVSANVDTSDLASLTGNNSFSGANSYSGSTTFTGAVTLPTAADVNLKTINGVSLIGSGDVLTYATTDDIDALFA